ncbi:MAG: hypothetical protein NT028_14535 [candidate division Zixibacteria bacterium]|nr:hypothetical protein [candidate division Zixibacteria bacterium]
MSKKDFEAFLKKQASADMRDKAIDWDREKQDWLRRIDEFYGTVQEWLKEYVNDGKVQIRFESTILNEEHIGSYETKKLYLRMASQEVGFSPIGTL